ncbi:LapA family protein [uncultured Nitrospira sp.]|uniref:LapA family protein n=1 Tax=uncultured Nitrospira sp. TaxID=157176 RepID=UPI003140A269
MYSALLALLLLLFFSVAFSIQNSEPIIINFFAWTFQGSRAVMLLTALALGVSLSLLASLPSYIKKSRLIAKQQKTIAALERSVAELTNPPSNI